MKYQTGLLIVFGLTVGTAGCALWNPDREVADELENYYELMHASPPVDVNQPLESTSFDQPAQATEAPRTLLTEPPDTYWELTLQDAVQLALAHSDVFRDLGGTVLRAPSLVNSPLDPAIQSTDPQRGVDAALSQFDPVFQASLFNDNNDRILNNRFLAGGQRQFKQDLGTYHFQLQKPTAFGTVFSVGHHIGYDSNNATGNLFPSAWDAWFDFEARQPLMQGAGSTFNRIAGPNAMPGMYQGVVVARTNTDISLTEFRIGLRNLVSDVENAYWDLYFAYRLLDARVQARDASLKTWRKIQAAVVEGSAIDPSREAQAREQYYRFQQEVENALSGRLTNPTQGYNGQTGGTFLGTNGIQVAERRLRLLLGVPLTDERLIRPADAPPEAPVHFDWANALTEGLANRGELHRQRHVVKLKELELIASKNFLLPRMDVVARQRFRGFGKQLLDYDTADPISSAYGNLFDFNYQETQLGLEFTLPTGYRKATAALRNAQLQLAMERSLLEAQEQQVAHDVANAFAEVVRAYRTLQTGYNRRAAALTQLEILQSRVEEDLLVNLDQLLDAERVANDADANFHRNAVEYAMAIKNLHLEKGTLLDYHEIAFAEATWNPGMLNDPNRRGPQDPEAVDYRFEDLPLPESRSPSATPRSPDESAEPPQTSPNGDDELPLRPAPSSEAPRTPPSRSPRVTRR